MGKKVDLDFLSFSEVAYAAIDELSMRMALAIRLTGGAKRAEDIPDLEGEIEDDGSLTIIIVAPIGQGRAEARLTIPLGHWTLTTDGSAH